MTNGATPRRTHWDSLLEEMIWLATDFQNERRWKHGVARKAAHKAAQRVRRRRQEQVGCGARRAPPASA